MRAALVLSLIVSLSRADESKAKDVLLSGFYLGKASAPFLLLPAALDDGDMVLWVDMGLFTVMTLPASGVLYQRWLGNREKVGLWRKINFGTDLTLAGGGALYGLYMIGRADANPDGPSGFISDDLAGIMVVFASVLYGLAALTERISFSSESSGRADLKILPLLSIQAKSAGLALRYRF